VSSFDQQQLFVDRPAGRDRRADPAPATPTSTPPIEVRVSKRRRKSATAYWSAGRIVVVVPAHLRGSARAEMVEWLVAKVLARRPSVAASDDVLLARAVDLARRFVPGAEPVSVRWVVNQTKRWASCTSQSGDIRVSERLRGVPDWVLDAVLVHELAHLVHPDHSASFYALAGRYPRQAEASAFLEGYSLGLDGRATPTR
jgi:predicted metal-dependent hydrolase